MTGFAPLGFACPHCHAALEQTAPDTMCCPHDRLLFHRTTHIWRMLQPEREAIFSQFTREYELVRRAERRGSQLAEYYRSLPYHDLSGRMVGDWRIRATSFDTFLKRIVIPMEAYADSPRRILDLGAGNGWLANQLAGRGHIVAAVDLITNDFDGLGCYHYYESTFTPVQAEFDCLPFTDQSIDLVIFNASLHYSTQYERTLSESLRVLDPNGKIVVLDSPFYHDPTSGVKMVQEREGQFVKRFGFPSNALHSENYLTYPRLANLAASLHLSYQVLTPFYGVQWALRPLKARLIGRREPAKFHLVVFSTQPNNWQAQNG